MGQTVKTILMTALVISVQTEESAWMGLILTTASVPQSGLVWNFISGFVFCFYGLFVVVVSFFVCLFVLWFVSCFF